jgi:hypothetical protein
LERRLFQGIVGLLSLVPLIGLAIGLTSGVAYFLPAGSAIDPDLDNQFRYLSGVYTAVTIAIWWTLPRLEERLAPLRIVCAGIVLGGIGRLASMATHGPPEDRTMVAGVVLEVVIVPLLLVWHTRLARRA